MKYNDPYLPRIWGLFSAGLLCTGFAIPGYLHQTEVLNLGLMRIQMPAPLRKIPLAFTGAVLTVLAWNATQDRREWKDAMAEQLQQQARLRQVEYQAELQARALAAQQLAQMQAAQQVYGQLQPYLDVDAQVVDQPRQPPVTPSQQGAIAPYPSTVTPVSQPVTPALPSPSQDNYAYLDLFTEYAGLLFGGQGSGKSWTTRLIVARKKQAGQRVIVLDPHAAQHEWLGVEHIGSGMDYKAIAEFLRWYLGEVVRRYRDFSQSGLSEAQWQAQMRQQGQVLSVVCEEMTNWADRLPDGLSAEFMKTGMSDSRKALMPPLFVAHNRTLSCLGDAKGLAHLRDSSLLELELVPKIDEVTFQPVASGYGRLKLPGHSQWRDVSLPPASQKITDFRAYGLAQSPDSFTQQGSAAHPQEGDRPASNRSGRPTLEQLRSWIQDCWSAEEAEEPISDQPASHPQGIPEHLQALVKYCQGRGWVKAAEIQRNVRAYDGLSTVEIRKLFHQAVGIGIGRISGEGNQLAYSVDSL